MKLLIMNYGKPKDVIGTVYILARFPTKRCKSLLGVWRSLLGLWTILLGFWVLHECTLARLLDAKCTMTKPYVIRVEVKGGCKLMRVTFGTLDVIEKWKIRHPST